MAIDPTRIMDRTRCTGARNGTRFYVLGVLPAGENLADWSDFEKVFRDQFVVAFVQAQTSSTDVKDILPLVEAAALAWTQPVRKRGIPQPLPSPRSRCLERWRSRLHYYVAEDPEGQKLHREEPFVYPADFLLEGIHFAAKLYPGSTPNVVLGEGREQLLTPKRTRDPHDAAKWWGYFEVDWGVPQEERVDVTKFHGADGSTLHGEA